MKEKLKERTERIMPDGRAMILAYDRGFEHGPRMSTMTGSLSFFEFQGLGLRGHLLLFP